MPKRLALFLIIPLLLACSVRAYGKDTSRFNNVMPDGCVTCGWNGRCRTCVGGGSGANCDTIDCSTCSPGGTCNTNIEAVQQEVTVVPPTSENPLRLNFALIKDIAAKHPRFGATLANRNMFGFLPGTRTIYWTPIEITPNDIDAFLNRKNNEAFFRKYNERAGEINVRIQKGEVQEIVYKLFVEQPDASTWTIKLQLANSPQLPECDPPFSTLEIKLTAADPSAFTSPLADAAKLIKTSWQVY